MIQKHNFISFSLLLCLTLFTTKIMAQSYTIHGQVVDASTQETLIGVNVIEKIDKKTNGTVTDLNGNFTLTVSNPSSSLAFSYIGYDNKIVPIDGKTAIKVELFASTQNLDEVVVVGYGSMKKSDLTGSITTIKSSDLTKLSNAQAVAALQGKASGVTVIQSGAPGESPVIKIRGIGTTNNSNPLYVVDGVLLDDMLFLSNEDIESIQVLKDASATAIYGSRGANGVIIVTTKQGQKGKAKINFSGYEGFQYALRDHLDLCDATQFATLYNEGLKEAGIETGHYEDPQKLGKGTDWLGEILRTSSIRNYSVSASGGGENVSYNASFTYYNQEGIREKSGYERFTFRLNNEYKVNKYVKFGHNLSYMHSDREMPLGGAIQTAYRLNPDAKVYDENGNFADSGHSSKQNVVADIHYHNQNVERNRLVGNAYLDINFLSDFTFKSNAGIDINNGYERYFRPQFFISNLHQQQTNDLSKTWSKYNSWLWENTLTYTKNIKNIHNFNVLLGYTLQEFNHEDLNGSGQEIPNQDQEDMWYLGNINKATAKVGNTAWSSSMMSYLFRLNYSYMDRYLATVSFRADGSSKFGPNNRWGYFPSVALGWRIKEESFLKNVDAISNLKIRGSWGKTGNDKIGNYQYYPTVYINSANCDQVIGGAHQPGATTVVISNQDIHWESTTQTDIGFELGLFNNKLNLEFDYYNRVTSDMLLVPSIPGFVGAAAADANVGKVRNRGIDFMLEWRDQLKNNFNYSVRFVGSTISNKVIDLNDKKFYGGGLLGGKNVTITKEGLPMSTFYGYKVVGVYQNQQQIDHYNAIDGNPETAYNTMYNVAPGDLIFADTNGDGKITVDDKTDIGSPLPKFTGSLGFTIEWKGFDLSIDLYGSFGNKIYNGKRAARNANSDNFDTQFLDRWTGEGTSNKEPRLTFEGNNWEVSERFIENGSYVKIQNVILGYTLPKELSKKLLLDNLRVYIAGDNLKYFTKYHGFTPEIGGDALSMGVDNSFYPVAATYKVGLNITF